MFDALNCNKTIKPIIIIPITSSPTKFVTSSLLFPPSPTDGHLRLEWKRSILVKCLWLLFFLGGGEGGGCNFRAPVVIVQRPWYGSFRPNLKRVLKVGWQLTRDERWLWLAGRVITKSTSKLIAITAPHLHRTARHHRKFLRESFSKFFQGSLGQTSVRVPLIFA